MDERTICQFEKNAILGLWNREKLPQIVDSEVVDNFLCGKFEDVLKTSGAARFFKKTSFDNLDAPTAVIMKNVSANFTTDNEHNDERLMREFELMALGVSCLQLFVQNNWVGPVTERLLQTKEQESGCLISFDLSREVEDHMYTELGLDGEAVVYRLSRHVIYLYIARCILLDCREYLQSLPTSRWWLMRCLAIQQTLLDDKSPTLKATILQLMDEIINMEPLMTNENSRDLKIVFHVEAGYLCHTYYEYKKAKEHYNTALKISSLVVELTGALGKRTKWQVEEKAQLVLEIKRQPIDTECVEVSHNDDKSLQNQVQIDSGVEYFVPKNLELDDEDRLNKIAFSDSERNFTPDLTAIELVLLLGLLENHRRTRASERLLDEEIEAYISCILNHQISWCVQEAALVIRSKIENNNRRTVERSMNQLEELTSQIHKMDPPANKRLDFIYSVNIPPVWIIQKELASLLVSLGSIGSALQIYERLHLWEDVIKCYQRIGKRDIAENIIRDQLAIKTTPELLCYLGDVTGDKTHYEAAWELSNQRSARAMRCLAYIYFNREDYEKSMDCFQKSLAINSLQIPVWFTYGCASMTAEQFKVAVKAFKKCVMIDFENFEAWNNLSAAYIKLNDKEKAFRTLKEAIKCSYDNWRVWENFLIVCTDIGEFDEAIHAYNRLLDLKEKYVDIDILKIFVRIVDEQIPDVRGKPSSKLRNKFFDLFERITSATTTNGHVWKLYAKLTSSGGNDAENPLKVHDYLQKAQRCFTQTGNWEKDISKCQEIVDNSTELARTCLQCFGNEQSCTNALQLLSSTKLALRGVLNKLKQHHTDPITHSLPENVQQLCEQLDSHLSPILVKIDELKSS